MCAFLRLQKFVVCAFWITKICSVHFLRLQKFVVCAFLITNISSLHSFRIQKFVVCFLIFLSVTLYHSGFQRSWLWPNSPPSFTLDTLQRIIVRTDNGKGLDDIQGSRGVDLLPCLHLLLPIGLNVRLYMCFRLVLYFSVTLYHSGFQRSWLWPIVPWVWMSSTCVSDWCCTLFPLITFILSEHKMTSYSEMSQNSNPQIDLH